MIEQPEAVILPMPSGRGYMVGRIIAHWSPAVIEWTKTIEPSTPFWDLVAENSGPYTIRARA